MMNIYPTLLAVLWGMLAAAAAWYCARLAGQITYITLADGRRQSRRIPFLFKLIMPLTPNMKALLNRPAFRSTIETAERRLTAAGFHGLLRAEEITALRFLMPLVLGPAWVVLVSAFMFMTPFELVRDIDWALYCTGPLWLGIYPTAWLRRAVAARHRSIRRALPFVLDILTLSVEAGMDFMTAIQRNIDRRALDELGEELLTLTREIQLGKTRREALRDMAARVDLPDLRSVVNALVQADELGVSIGSILRIQADQIRQRRFERAERLANEAPVKMLAPLLLFIFPSVFLVLLGPIITKLLQQLS